MGYYTKFHLSVLGGRKNNRQDYIKVGDFFENQPDDGEFYELKDIWNGEAESMKFYAHEESLRALSLNLPEICFILEGDGEEQGDVWRKVALNGEIEELRPQLVWPESRLVALAKNLTIE